MSGKMVLILAIFLALVIWGWNSIPTPTADLFDNSRAATETPEARERRVRDAAALCGKTRIKARAAMADGGSPGYMDKLILDNCRDMGL
jgi:hypothetical protein